MQIGREGRRRAPDLDVCSRSFEHPVTALVTYADGFHSSERSGYEELIVYQWCLWVLVRSLIN